MKTRNGFVSNSSSTSFTFCLGRKSIEDLSRLILKYSSHFNLQCEYSMYEDFPYSCNAEGVAKAIEETYKLYADPKNAEAWDKTYFVTTLECIADLEEVLASQTQRKDKNQADELNTDEWYKGYLVNYIEGLKKRIEMLKMAEKKGLKAVFKIDFGDNHGNVSGGALGTTMDYEGRSIGIDEEDFMVFTEQNR